MICIYVAFAGSIPEARTTPNVAVKPRDTMQETSRAGRAEPSAPVRRVATETLLGGARELILEHRGELYRLRVTANGKLILTK
jgi:hemin uptake protein HemP